MLDEFDLFAKGTRQTLLYNLLDAMQATDMQVGSPALVAALPARLLLLHCSRQRLSTW